MLYIGKVQNKSAKFPVLLLEDWWLKYEKLKMLSKEEIGSYLLYLIRMLSCIISLRVDSRDLKYG